jgi:hypothetical protein
MQVFVAMQRLVDKILIAMHKRNITVSTVATIRLSEQHTTGQGGYIKQIDFHKVPGGVISPPCFWGI